MCLDTFEFILDTLEYILDIFECIWIHLSVFGFIFMYLDTFECV